MTGNSALRASLLALALISSGRASAAILSLDYVGPGTPSIGDTFAYQLRLGELDPTRGTDELLAGFSGILSFNSEIVNFERVQFSPLLGDPSLFEAVTSVDTPSNNTVLLGNVSLLEADITTCIFCISPFLSDLQRDPGTGQFLDSLLLAAFVFSGASEGVSPINLSNLVLSDPNGSALFSDLTNGLVIRDSVTVPEPSTALLFLLGLVGLGAVTAGRGSRRHNRMFD